MNELLLDVPPGMDPVGLMFYAANGETAGTCVAGNHEKAEIWDPAGAFEDGCDLFASLADSATRDRLLRWVAGMCRMDAKCGVIWHQGCNHDGDDGWVMFVADAETSSEHYFGGYDEEGSPLCGLNPDNDETLPDGSRKVDALALGLIVRHLAVPE